MRHTGCLYEKKFSRRQLDKRDVCMFVYTRKFLKVTMRHTQCLYVCLYDKVSQGDNATRAMFVCRRKVLNAPMRDARCLYVCLDEKISQGDIATRAIKNTKLDTTGTTCLYRSQLKFNLHST